MSTAIEIIALNLDDPDLIWHGTHFVSKKLFTLKQTFGIAPISWDTQEKDDFIRHLKSDL